MRICFVCLGNICRSPAAEALFAHRAEEAGLAVEVDSAGTADYHVGRPPHEQTVAEGTSRGLRFTHRGRQFTAADFAAFDLVVVMDASNERDVLALAPDDAAASKVVRLGQFGSRAEASGVQDVRDPWGHGPEVFSAMYDHLEDAVAGLLDHVRQRAPSAEPPATQ